MKKEITSGIYDSIIYPLLPLPNSLITKNNKPHVIEDFSKYDMPNPFFSNHLVNPEFSETRLINYKIQMFNRSNGTQPWIPSYIMPPMIGKMRKITIEFDNIPVQLELNIDIKLINSKGNDSTLLISENHRMYKKNRNESEKSSISYSIQPTHDTKNECDNSFSKSFFLKPQWYHFGPRKAKPEFEINIFVTDTQKTKSVTLHSWNTEVHCHKMESSLKGKEINKSFGNTSLNSFFYF